MTDWAEESTLGVEQVKALVAAMGKEGGSMTTAAEVAFHFEAAWRESQILVAIEGGHVRLERDEEDPDLWYAVRIKDDVRVWQFHLRKAPNANEAIGQPEFN
jgi:hypothetical protein